MKDEIFYRRIEEYYEEFCKTGRFPVGYYASENSFDGISTVTGAHMGYIFLYEYLNSENEKYLQKACRIAQFILSMKAGEEEEGITGCIMHGPNHRGYTWTNSVCTLYLLDLYIVTGETLYLEEAKGGIKFLKDKQNLDGSWFGAFVSSLCNDYQEILGRSLDPGTPINFYPYYNHPPAPEPLNVGAPIETLVVYSLLTGDEDSLRRAKVCAEYAISRQKDDGRLELGGRVDGGLWRMMQVISNIRGEGIYDLYRITKNEDYKNLGVRLLSFWKPLMREDGRMPAAYYAREKKYLPVAFSFAQIAYSRVNLCTSRLTKGLSYLQDAALAFNYYLQSVSKTDMPNTIADYGAFCPDAFYQEAGPHGEGNYSVAMPYWVLDELEHVEPYQYGSNRPIQHQPKFAIIKEDDNEYIYNPRRPLNELISISRPYFLVYKNRHILHLEKGVRGIFGYKNILWGEKRDKAALYGYIEGYFDESSLDSEVRLIEKTAKQVKIEETKGNSYLRLRRSYLIEDESQVNIEEEIEILDEVIRGKIYLLRIFISPIGYTVNNGLKDIRLWADNNEKKEYDIISNGFNIYGLFPFGLRLKERPYRLRVIDHEKENRHTHRGEEIQIALELVGNEKIFYSVYCDQVPEIATCERRKSH